MAYTRQNLKDGDCLCAHNLKKMEDALCDMPCVEKAKAGQVLAVAEVDENGKPISYRAVNVEGGGGGGAAINGIPEGGKAGQYLRKVSDFDFDVEWADLEIPSEYGLVTYDDTKTLTIT